MMRSQNLDGAICSLFGTSVVRIFLAIFIFSGLSAFSGVAIAQVIGSGEMRAHYIDVGQGSATLLEFSCGAVLIDAGAEGPVTQAGLIRYLDRFFARRTDLNRTLQSVIITHAHKDHNVGLMEVLTKFQVLNYIDNGLRKGSGRFNQNWAQDNAGRLGMTYANYSYDKIKVNGKVNGHTDGVIDPVNCQGVDPVISVLSGRFDAPVGGMTVSELEGNGNLHSLVVKVVFGKSSFLFTGDLEEKAMHTVAKYYMGSGTLNSDVWQVSHHGSYNGVTMGWLKEVSPKFAVISCGKWDSGKVGAKDRFNTYTFGHPRIAALDMLQASIKEERPLLDSVVAFYGQREKHRNYKVTKNIYCNAWDGNIVIRAFDNGKYEVVDKW
ncbi:ComEC/Rec2 family competence protein [Pedobacter helvus]|uniref:ComEC/Rec2 family competence protein n=1 Tax=Pedobacter helvus TaxID=2563444 RepID=A0ABW9JL95_9SPHI|nr:MBL fold metallo-hydrolase [Pedobacter ureilyticus]